MAKAVQSGQVSFALAAKLAGAVAIAALVANCASQQPGGGGSRSREIGAFSDPKYGKASPRVVGIDDDAPKGGGRYQVGRPYSVAGRRYVPREKPVGYTVTGNASWYGVAFHGRKTANGEVYDRNSVSAAHPTMPLPSYARVTNTANNHSIVVRVNDRGPYHGGRVLDVSEKTAHLLNFKHMGTARVKVDYLGPAALVGSDDKRLIASLRTNGPAAMPASGMATTMVASAAGAVAPSAAPPQAMSFSAQPAPAATRPLAATPALGSNAVETGTPSPGLPLPPQRPFDLETIGGASTPVGGRLPAHSPTSLSFSEDSGFLTRFVASSSFGMREGFGPSETMDRSGK